MGRKSKYVKCEVMKRKGSAIVVKYSDDDENVNVVVIPTSDIKNDNGSSVDVDRDVLDVAIDFGVDFEILFPEGVHIELDDIQSAFHKRGIYSQEDVMNNPRALSDIAGEFTRLILVQLRRRIDEELGG